MEPTVQSQVTLESSEGSLPHVERGFSFHFAAEYFDRGWSVIPLSGKRPAVPSWLEFQEHRAGLSDIRRWFKDDSVNVGIVTGKLSGLVVVDCDSPDDASFWKESFPKTPLAVVTGRGGNHFYYRYPLGEEVFNRAGLINRKIDLRGQGGYVVAPPSRHPNGTHYRWQGSEHYCLDELPYFSPAWVSTRSVWRLVAREELPQPLRAGRSVRWRLSDVESWIDASILRNKGDRNRRIH